MPHTPGGQPVPLNGTQWVEVVAAPASGNQRAVVGLRYFNRDSVQHNVELQLLKGGVETQLIPAKLVGAGLEADLVTSMFALDATDESLRMRTAEATTATESLVTPSYVEKTP